MKIDMDNRTFNVNGYGREFLFKTLQLAFEHGCNKKAIGWSHSIKSGMILYHHHYKGMSRLPKMSAEEVTNVVWAYLQSDEAKEVTLDEIDGYVDTDVVNTLGWRVFCEDWGRIEGIEEAFIAIKLSYLWSGSK